MGHGLAPIGARQAGQAAKFRGNLTPLPCALPQINRGPCNQPNPKREGNQARQRAPRSKRIKQTQKRDGQKGHTTHQAHGTAKLRAFPRQHRPNGQGHRNGKGERREGRIKERWPYRNCAAPEHLCHQGPDCADEHNKG